MGAKEILAITVVSLVLVGISLFVGWHFGSQGFNPLQKGDTLSASDFNEAYSLVQSDFYETATASPLIADAITGLLGGLNDKYSFYLPKDIYQCSGPLSLDSHSTSFLVVF